MQKKQRQDGRETAFITNKGQFVSQTEDKKFITTSRVKKKKMKPSISQHVRAAICNILDLGTESNDTESKTRHRPSNI